MADEFAQESLHSREMKFRDTKKEQWLSRCRILAVFGYCNDLS